MKIFYLTPRVPFPIDKGDKLRAYHQIKHLSEMHEIFLYAIDENAIHNAKDSPLQDFCKGMKIFQLSRIKILRNLVNGVFKSVPFQTSYYYSKEIADDIKIEIKKFQPDVILCQLIRAAKFVEDINDIPKVIDYVDVISKGLERRINKSNLLMKFLLKWEYKRAVKYEKRVAEIFDAQIIITDEDKSLLQFKDKNKVKIIPNGIDFEFFQPVEHPKEYDLFFSGNLSYPPNIDAAEFLVKEIMPIVWKTNPNAKVLIAGASPKKRVLSLASNNIHVNGWTDDIRDYYKTARIFIAPLQIGTGLQNKLLQAMAMKMPCVVSELTQKGVSQEKCDFMLVANEPEEYAEHVNTLLNNSKAEKEISEKGFNYVKHNYEWKKIILDLEKILLNCISKKNGAK
ncbi:MAG: glycosyltransferase [Ignavibacteria bacterium]|nr:glycosyltransferase [Ignavibacteria bacterium]